MAKFKKPSFTFPTLLESKDKRSVSPVHKSFKSGYHAGGSAVHSPQETAKMQAEQMFKAQTGQMAAQPATQTPQVAIDPSKQTQRLRGDQLTAERPTTTVTPMTAEQRAERKRQLSLMTQGRISPEGQAQGISDTGPRKRPTTTGMVSPEGQAKGISDTGPRKRPTTTGVQQARRVGGPTDLTIGPKLDLKKLMGQKAYERIMERQVDRSKPLTELEQAQVREGAKNPAFFDDTPPPGETIDTSNRDVRRSRNRRELMMDTAFRGRLRPIDPMRPRSPFPTPFPRTSPRNVPFGRSIRNTGLRKLLGFGPPPPQQKGTTTKATPVRKLTPQTAPPSFKPPARDPNAPPGYYDQVQLAQMNKGGVTKKSKKRKK